MTELEILLAEAATGLWRIHGKLTDTDQASADQRLDSVLRQVRRTVEALAEGGVRIEGHRGAPFHPGAAIDVVAYQPTGGLEHEVVIDVERPSVFRGRDTLQRGRVVVGVPDGSPR